MFIYIFYYSVFYYCKRKFPVDDIETDVKRGRELLCEIIAMFSRSQVPKIEWPEIHDVFSQCTETVSIFKKTLKENTVAERNGTLLVKNCEKDPTSSMHRSILVKVNVNHFRLRNKTMTSASKKIYFYISIPRNNIIFTLAYMLAVEMS